MDQTASECGRKLREWMIEQIEASRPLETSEVVMEATPEVDIEPDGSVPPMPATSGPHDDPTGVPWRFRHKVTVFVPDPSATAYADRLIGQVARAVEEDWTLGGRVDRGATVEAEGTTVTDDAIEVNFSTTVGFPPV